MSIITTAPAVPNRLLAIYSFLFATENGESEERLESWATPPSLGIRGVDEDGALPTTLFDGALQEARRLGIVEEVDDKLRLSLDARGAGKKGSESEGSFRTYLRNTLFDPGRAVETQQMGFMLALTWFLSANPLEPMSFSEGPQNAVKAEIGENLSKTELTSINRYQNFLYWARYLGFATIVGGRDTDDTASRRAVPDPVRAIHAVLPIIFADSDELPIEAFLSRLSAIYPVFEKGSIREEYDAMRLNAPADTTYRLSISTSMALQRLSDRQQLELVSVADAPARVLNLGKQEDRISHVIRKEVV